MAQKKQKKPQKKQERAKWWIWILAVALCLFLGKEVYEIPQVAQQIQQALPTEGSLTGDSSGSFAEDWSENPAEASSGEQTQNLTLDEIPEYSGDAYISVEGNEPDFTQEDLSQGVFEEYSELDNLGRCGTAFANVGTETMPQETRAPISKIKPTGWRSVKYDNINGKYLYNRCHLIGFQLTAENANERNLITGTRYLNIEGMLPFENAVADYIKETENHVLYRVTPVFEEGALVASGVQMEAMSVEDQGEGIFFNVYVYNVQPGILIDYQTGESSLDGEEWQ